jgi:hypothetical protein
MLKSNSLFVVLLGGVFLLGSVTLAVGQQGASVQPQGASPAMSEAEALFQAQKWADARRAFEALTKVEPANGRAWLRLGGALHALGQYAEAARALERAVEILRGPIAMYNLACAYARLNDKERAFEWLNKAINAGFPQVSLMPQDEDLATLRDDARFKEVLALGERLTKPCLYAPAHRQFDFWIGEWDVQMGGLPAGTSRIERILDGCVIFENWTGARGGTGKSFNFYNPATRKWQQTWVDSTGNVLELAGDFKDEKMQFSGETRQADGKRTLHRLTFFQLSGERVRQFWEQSTDNGQTWTTAFDGIYTRKKTAQP